MIKQRFTLYASLAFMLLVWLVPQQASGQTIKCTGGMANLNDVKIHLGCGDWYDVSFKGHPGFSYSVTVDGIFLSTFTGQNGEYSIGTAKSKFSAGDTIVIVQTCTNSSGGSDSDIFRAILPPDLTKAGTYAFVALGTAGTTNTAWMANQFTSSSPTDVPSITITPDNGQAWAPTCMGSSDGKWTFGATAISAAAYSDLDSLRYNLVSGTQTGSGTIPSSGKVTISGYAAGAVSANVIAYSGSCTDTVTVTNIVPAGSNEPTVACNSSINVSVDAQCMASLNPRMMLAGTTDLCGIMAMDSIVIKHADGTMIDVTRNPGDTITIENASEYIHGKPLIAEVHASGGGVTNYCWGNLVIEDKLAPVLTCDVKKVVACYHFDGTTASNITALDCDPNPKTNIVNERIITDCKQIGGGLATDSILKRIIRTYNATDAWGNTSENCTDTLDVRRLDAVLTNNTGSSPKLDISGLIVPINYVSYNDPTSAADTNAFVCDSRFPFADYDNDHIPDPVDFVVTDSGDTLRGAGVPRIDTVIGTTRWNFALHPSNYVHVHENVAKLLETCKTVVTYSDTKLPRVGCVEKVVRTFEIREWVCGHETVLRINQTIEIVDTLGPSFTKPADMKVSTNLKTCERYMSIPVPTDISDYCKKSEPGRIIVNAYNDEGEAIGSLNTDDGTFNATTGGSLNIPVGVNKIEYHVFDNCHNVTIDSIKITVVDETAPVVICKEFLVVGIADDNSSGNNEVWINADAFDNGSYDDCGLASKCVARMSHLNAFDAFETAGVGGRLTAHGAWYVPLDSMNFSCDQTFGRSGVVYDTVGTVIDSTEYIFRDALCTPQLLMCCEDAGNSTMVVFRVTDKAGNRNECMVEVEAQDKRRPTIHCPPDLTIDCRFDFATDAELNIFGNVVAQGSQEAIGIPAGYVLEKEAGKDLVDGVWFGNCDATVAVTVESDINECRQGTITRTFVVTANNGSTAKCKQTITLSRDKVLKVEDIKFPEDVTMTGCIDPALLTPDSTGYPSVDDADCTLVGWAYEDLTVRFNNNDGDACFKIVRQWTVIDWCKQPSFTIGTGTQVIKVNDDVAPVIAGTCDAVTVQVLDADCQDGPISLSQTASDNCTETANLIWEVQVDRNNDGSINNRFRVTADENGIVTVSGDYPIGTHRFIWEVRDQCGNEDVCEQLVTIRNIKKPTPICLTTITGSLMPIDDGSSQNGQDNDDVPNDGIADGGMLTVWANEYNIGSSSHPCGYDLVYSFDSLSVVGSRDLTCDDLSNGVSTTIDMPVYVLAIERINGDTSIVSFDHCSVQFVLDDNNLTCDTITFNPANVLITGNIHTESSENVPTVEVALQGVNSGASTNATKTDLGGMYAFDNMPLGGTYKIVPALDKDILNGVSTLDLVLIQKHILGLDPLPSPYKIIAADVNRDNNVSAIDLVELRKVILGIADKFNNNNSWRFIDEAYTFSDPLNPLSEQFKESYGIEELARTMIIDFVGVKVGDVNGNVSVNNLLTAPRSSASIVMENVTFEAGETVRVPVSFKGISELLGYQFTLEFDNNAIAFAGFDGGSIDLATENFGIQKMDQGVITASWGNVEAKNIADREAFVLEFSALKSGILSEVISISSSVTTAEVYNSDAEVMGLNLAFESIGDEVNFGYELFQNTPNPFAQSTSIGFMLPRDADATINIFDVTGKLVKAYSGSFAKGLNTITVDKNDINTTGVLYYTLDTKDFTSTRRMVLIK